jgi:hypothetical protein
MHPRAELVSECDAQYLCYFSYLLINSLSQNGSYYKN